MTLLAHFLVAAVIGVLIDAVWIAGVANKFYKSQMGSLLAPKPDLIPAAIFYVLFIAGILFFVVEPGLDGESLGWVAGHAAFLGLTMYATYDLTNASTLKNWPRKLTIVDMTWGTALTTVIAVVTYLIFR